MVLLLDLDDEVPDPHADPNEPAGFVLRHRHHRDQKKPVTTAENEDNEVVTAKAALPNPNQSNGLAADVACYPYVNPSPPTHPSLIR